MFARTQTASARRTTTRKNRNYYRYNSTARTLGPVSLTITLALMIGVLALLYLTQITKTSVYGYEVNVLTSEEQDLAERNQELAVEAARLRSIDRIKKSDVAGDLTPEQQVTFIRPDTN